jgi:DNA-binding response OmpR family regulator
VDDHSHNAAKRTVAGGPVRVVLVEDLAPLRRLVSSVLAYEGIEVRAAATMAEGLALLEAAETDVLVTDNLLPDGTGLELAERARRIQPGLATLCVSGTTPVGGGFDRFVAKPFEVEALAAEIVALADARRARGTPGSER